MSNSISMVRFNANNDKISFTKLKYNNKLILELLLYNKNL